MITSIKKAITYPTIGQLTPKWRKKFANKHYWFEQKQAAKTAVGINLIAFGIVGGYITANYLRVEDNFINGNIFFGGSLIGTGIGAIFNTNTILNGTTGASLPGYIISKGLDLITYKK